ncbi:MAG: MBL fold metallo-hydrolase [Anaerolineales bacterium]
MSLGYVNAFLLEGEGGLTLIDTGVPGSEGKISAALRELGRAPQFEVAVFGHGKPITTRASERFRDKWGD